MVANDVMGNGAPARAGAQRMLVVDDDVAIRHALRLLLEDEGLAVAEVADGRAALAILRAASLPPTVLAGRSKSWLTPSR